MPASLAPHEVAGRLSSLAETAAAMTSSVGAAIAIRDEAGRFVCRANAGRVAPEVGVAVNANTGLTGECIRNGRQLNCRDTRRDRRVHPSVAADFGIRSILVVPIVQGRAVTGIIEVLASSPSAFDRTHVTELERIASEIGRITARNATDTTQSSARTLPEPPSSPFHGNAATVNNSPSDLSLSLSFLEPPKQEARLISRKLSVVGTVLATGAILFAITVRPQPRSTGVVVEQPVPKPVRAERSRQLEEEQATRFEAAAEQGSVGAQSMLAVCYWTGRGVPVDMVAAYKWSAIAAAQGDRSSMERLRILEASISAADQKEAQRQSEAWLARHRTQRANR